MDWPFFQWLTGTTEAVVLVEYLLLALMVVLFREMRKNKEALEEHEKGCADRRVEEAKWQGSVNTRLDGIDTRLQRGEQRFDNLEQKK